MRSRSWFIVYLLVVVLIVAYLVRVILTPFILAAILAYVLNPVVKLLEKKLHINKITAILLIYVAVFATVVYASIWLGAKVIYEISQLRIEVKDVNNFGQDAVARLPEWQIAGQSVGFQSLVATILVGLNNTISHIQSSLLTIFTGALNRVLQVLVFLVATFYFLKDGSRFIAALKNKFSPHHQKDVEEMLRQINEALGGYLRGQILLVLIMSVATSIVLSILGVRFAILLGVLSGFLELIPFIGPVVAGGIAASTAFILGNNHFGFDPTTLALVVILFYFLLRQVEDYFIVPQLLGRLTKVHPLVVLFAVLAGGKIAGPVGFILGVPIAASLRIILDYYWAKAKD